MNHYMCTNFWHHWYLDPSLFQLTNTWKQWIYDKFIIKVERFKTKPTSVFVKEYFKKYTSEKFLPSWMLVEELTIWEISTVYNLLKTNHRVKISSVYNTYEKDFWTWLQLLNTLRNISAHHWRLWNRKYVTKLKVDDVIFREHFQTKLNQSNRKEVIPNYHNAILVIYYLLNKINKNFWWLDDLNNLISKYDKVVNVNNMWLGKNWKKDMENIINQK
jgi:abortive infection bacteriophage resistance protein